MEKTMEKIVALAKARGFVYPGSEIYGGLANTWDYGNLGVEPLQRRCGLCDPDESPDLGGQWTSGWFLRSSDGL